MSEIVPFGKYKGQPIEVLPQHRTKRTRFAWSRPRRLKCGRAANGYPIWSVRGSADNRQVFSEGRSNGKGFDGIRTLG